MDRPPQRRERRRQVAWERNVKVAPRCMLVAGRFGGWFWLVRTEFSTSALLAFVTGLRSVRIMLRTSFDAMLQSRWCRAHLLPLHKVIPKYP